jgi:Domain of unknown function (DUF397)
MAIDSLEFGMPTMSSGRTKFSATSWEGILAAGLDNVLKWRKSSRCEGGACIEIAVQGDAILVRSSADPDSPILAFSPSAWRDLIAGIKQPSLSEPGVHAVLGEAAMRAGQAGGSACDQRWADAGAVARSTLVWNNYSP